MKRDPNWPLPDALAGVTRAPPVGVAAAEWQAAVARAVPDPAVGIRLARLGERDGQALLVAAIPRQVGCHVHHHGVERYEVVRGAGLLLVGPVSKEAGKWQVRAADWRSVQVGEGDAFDIPGGVAHQLRNAGTEADLVILVQCPDSHLTSDRTLLPDGPAG